jgi:hypothetical protein
VQFGPFQQQQSVLNTVLRIRITIFFDENNVNGLESISAKCLEQLGFYIKIFIILYADDTVIRTIGWMFLGE